MYASYLGHVPPRAIQGCNETAYPDPGLHTLRRRNRGKRGDGQL